LVLRRRRNEQAQALSGLDRILWFFLYQPATVHSFLPDSGSGHQLSASDQRRGTKRINNQGESIKTETGITNDIRIMRMEGTSTKRIKRMALVRHSSREPGLATS
jgi:hypothetical protein